jgi:hypothetical protein
MKERCDCIKIASTEVSALAVGAPLMGLLFIAYNSLMTAFSSAVKAKSKSAKFSA